MGSVRERNTHTSPYAQCLSRCSIVFSQPHAAATPRAQGHALSPHALPSSATARARPRAAPPRQAVQPPRLTDPALAYPHGASHGSHTLARRAAVGRGALVVGAHGVRVAIQRGDLEDAPAAHVESTRSDLSQAAGVLAVLVRTRGQTHARRVGRRVRPVVTQERCTAAAAETRRTSSLELLLSSCQDALRWCAGDVRVGRTRCVVIPRIVGPAASGVVGAERSARPPPTGFGHRRGRAGRGADCVHLKHRRK